MDYAKLAQAALDEYRSLTEKAREVSEGTGTDAEKREQIERIDADSVAKLAEARDYADKAKRDTEARELSAALPGLVAATKGGEQRQEQNNVEQRDYAAELRGVANGELRFMDIDLDLAEQRAATTGTPGNAGYAHPTVTFVGELVKYMRERSEILNRARVLNTAGGEPMEMPRRITVPTAAGPIAENTAISKSDIGMDRFTLGAYKYGVIVEATSELVEDDRIGVLSLIAQDMGEVVADKVQTALITGTGSSQPTGLMTAATAGANSTVANGAALSADGAADIWLKLIYDVPVAYRKNLVIYTNDQTVLKMRLLKDLNGQYIFNDPREQGQPGTIWGVPVLTDPNIPASGAGAKVAVAVDLSKFLVRQVRDMRVVRSDEFGWDRDVVAFKCTWRGDSNLQDPSAARALVTTAA